MQITRTVYADKAGIIAQLQEQLEQAQSNAEMPTITRYRREFWRGDVEGLRSAIRLLQDWAGEEEPEPEPPVTCVCGYGPTTEDDLDQHILASMHVPGDHAARH